MESADVSEPQFFHGPADARACAASHAGPAGGSLIAAAPSRDRLFIADGGVPRSTRRAKGFPAGQRLQEASLESDLRREHGANLFG